MKQTIEGLQVANKTVFVRVDFNVPMKDGVITDDTRIRSALPTINYLIEKGAKVILASHFGRPKGERKPEMSLAPCAKHLSELINKPVAFVDDCIGPKVEEAVKALQSGDVDMAISIGPGEYRFSKMIEFSLSTKWLPCVMYCSYESKGNSKSKSTCSPHCSG